MDSSRLKALVPYLVLWLVMAVVYGIYLAEIYGPVVYSRTTPGEDFLVAAGLTAICVLFASIGWLLLRYSFVIFAAVAIGFAVYSAMTTFPLPR